MVEFFADSLVNGFLQSSMMGKFIVLVQLSASVVMVGIIIGKVKQLAHVGRLTRRVSRDWSIISRAIPVRTRPSRTSTRARANVSSSCFRRRRVPRLRMARARRARRSHATRWSW